MFRKLFNYRAAGVTKAQQLGALIETFPHRIINGGAEQTVLIDAFGQDQLAMAAISAVAGAAGALVAHLIPAEVLRIIMPVVLIGVAAFFALKPGLSDDARAERIKPAVFAVTVVPAIAAYDGFFGPGTGSFFMMSFVLLAGYGVLKATAHTKMLNFASNIGSLVVFIPSGAMWWGVGLAMAVAQIAGASLGARLAMRIGARLIKPLLVFTSTAMALRLLWQALA